MKNKFVMLIILVLCFCFGYVGGHMDLRVEFKSNLEKIELNYYECLAERAICETQFGEVLVNGSKETD